MPTRQDIGVALQGLGAAFNPQLAPLFSQQQQFKQKLEYQKEQDLQAKIDKEQARIDKENATQQAANADAANKKLGLYKFMLQNSDKFDQATNDAVAKGFKENYGIDVHAIPNQPKYANQIDELASLQAASTKPGFSQEDANKLKMLEQDRQRKISQEKAQLQNLNLPTRQERTVDKINRYEAMDHRTPFQENDYQRALAQYKKDVAVTGRTEWDTGFNKTTITALDKGLIKDQKALGRVMALDSAIKQNPGAVGAIGAARQTAGDYLSMLHQLGIPYAGELAKKIAPDTLIDTRGQSKLLTGAIIPMVTGDTSGKYSDFDTKNALEINAAMKNVTSARESRVLLGRLGRILNDGIENAKYMKKTGKTVPELMDQNLIHQNPDGSYIRAPLNKPFVNVTTPEQVDSLPVGTQYIWLVPNDPDYGKAATKFKE